MTFAILPNPDSLYHKMIEVLLEDLEVLFTISLLLFLSGFPFMHSKKKPLIGQINIHPIINILAGFPARRHPT